MERNVPKLRFKGFNDEWKEIKLGEFLTFYSTNSFSRDCLNYEKGDVQNIHYGDIHMKFPTILDTEKYSIPYINSDINISKYSEESFCKDGDLVIADASEDYADIGKSIEVCNIGNKKILAGLHTILARDNKLLTANGFKGYMMQSQSVRKQVKVLAAGAKVLGISKSNLEKVNVKLPSLKEQERIANFLTKVDKIIEKQEEKVKNLENYKKGMMQKIFSQEIRFKDENGNEYPEWEDKRIGDIFIEINEKTSIKNQYEVLSSTSTGLFKQSEYFNREIASEDNTGYKILRKKQIVLSPQNLWLGNINYNNKYETGIVSPSYKIFNVVENILPQFIAYIIKLDRMLYEYKQASEQGASVVRRNLNMDLFNDIVIKIPCYREQSRITAYLNNIDVILEKEKNKLEELKQWKKGLLQQMFV